MMLKQKSDWFVCRVKLEAEENHEANQGVTYFMAPTQIMGKTRNRSGKIWSRAGQGQGGTQTTNAQEG